MKIIKKSLTSVKKQRRKKTKFERVGEMLLPSVRQPAQRLNEKTRTEQEELNKGKKNKTYRMGRGNNVGRDIDNFCTKINDSA